MTYLHLCRDCVFFEEAEQTKDWPAGVCWARAGDHNGNCVACTLFSPKGPTCDDCKRLRSFDQAGTSCGLACDRFEPFPDDCPASPCATCGAEDLHTIGLYRSGSALVFCSEACLVDYVVGRRDAIPAHVRKNYFSTKAVNLAGATIIFIQDVMKVKLPMDAASRLSAHFDGYLGEDIAAAPGPTIAWHNTADECLPKNRKLLGYYAHNQELETDECVTVVLFEGWRWRGLDYHSVRPPDYWAYCERPGW